MNSLGQVVIEEKLNKDCCSKNLNIEALPKGIYFLQVNGKTIREVKKVMID